jgi:SprT protein
MIEPIDEARRQEVIAHSNVYIAQAESLYNQRFGAVDIRFDLSGGTAGMFRVDGKHCHLRYNPWLFAKYFEENLQGTVPHEVAHYITHELYGLHRIRPHGPEWLSVMSDFEADPTVTCDFDLSGIPQRRQRLFNYRCSCRTHEVSARRHNAMQRGKGRYECVLCKFELRPMLTS